MYMLITFIRLNNQQTGFDVGNTVISCTRGIWVWGKAASSKGNKRATILLDTEGLGIIFLIFDSSVNTLF